jgi:hypothetical protein
MDDLRLDTDFIDYAILATYFAVVLGVSEESGRGTARDRERPGGGGDARPQ